MKTSLNSLLKQITPLPWKRSGVHIYKQGDGKTGANIASAGSPRGGGTTVGYEPLRCGDPDLHEAYHNAEYLHHAATHLPKLVAALELLCEYGAKPAHMAACRQALADAQEVEL